MASTECIDGDVTLRVLQVHRKIIQSSNLKLFQLTLKGMLSDRGVSLIKDGLDSDFFEDADMIECIIGNHGVGKTRLLLSLLHKWTTEHHGKLSLYFDMRDCKDLDVVFKDSIVCTYEQTEYLRNRTGLKDVLTRSSLYRELSDSTIVEIVDIILRSDGEDITILVDHLDDLHTSDLNTSTFTNLLSRNLLPKANIITAGRFPSMDALSKIIRSPSRYHILEGIKPGCELQLLESLRAQFKDDRLYENVKYHCLDLCQVPGLVLELLAAFKDKPQTASIGSTRMIEPLVMTLIKRHTKNQKFEEIERHSLSLEETEPHSLSTLSDNLKTQLRLVGKLAYQFVESGIDNCCYSDLSRYAALENGVEQKLFQEQGLASIFLVNTIDGLGDEAYRFIHPIIQEFLAAYYVATEPLLNQICLIRENMDIIFTNKRFGNMVKFYFGIGHILSEAKRTSNEIIPEAVWTRKPILETLVGSQLHLDEEPDLKRKKLLLTFQLIHESQDRNLARKFLCRREKYLELTLKASLQLTEPLINNIAFIVGNSGISKWDIEAPESTVHSAEFIAMLVQRESSSKVSVRIQIADSDAFTIKPLAGSGSPLKEHLPNSAYVNCMREVLHCCLQLYSPIRLKSNSTDASYVSFLSCACLKEKIENEGVLILESLNAVHWIKVKGKEPRQKGAALKTGEDVELHHHMATHNMEHLEMVIMMSPLPNRIRYKTPSGANKMESIELFQTTTTRCLAGRIATSLKQHLRSDEVADVRDIAVEAQTTVGHSPPVLVALPFVIPLSFKNVMEKMVMNTDLDCNQKIAVEEKPNFPPRVQIVHNSNSRSEDTAMQESQYQSEAMAVPSTSDMIAYHQYPQHHQYTPYHQHSLHHQTSTPRQSSQQSVQQSQPVSGQKQVTVPPGTILHTANPDIFALNTVYSIPSEDNLLKKGGNGTVFTVAYGLREYAVKKTPFRSREFQIHKKLKHANIIELSCFMFGPPQQQYKRRFYCYHFMPRVTGDLARMVTDRRDLVMTSLTTKYQNDPLQLGSIQGNWKYILKELLKGLGYMHSLNVVHRDIKASNVLIKMLCACDNPLTCTCSQKCSVTIADFDAALQLDSSGCLQATTPPSQQKSSGTTYQVVPVGTDGYRSPELSQFVISNDLSILTPPLGVKTDIWSVGLILMRILNGSNGPAKQKKLSTLLLYYEQEKSNEQRAPKQPKFLKISKTEVDKILGIHKLREFSNNWTRQAVECISCCVEVDPEKRPSAHELLKHKFLY